MRPKPKTFVKYVPHCVFHKVFFCDSYLKWRIQECSFKQSLPLFRAFCDLNYDPRCVSMISQLQLLRLQRLTIQCRCLLLKEECSLQVCVWVAVCEREAETPSDTQENAAFFSLLLCFVFCSLAQATAGCWPPCPASPCIPRSLSRWSRPTRACPNLMRGSSISGLVQVAG